jgi:hypothetical protein
MIRAWTVPHNIGTNGTRKLLNIGVTECKSTERKILLTTDIKPGIDF